LLRIAAVLDVKLQDLLTPVRQLTAVRFRAAKKMTTREQILVDVSRWLDDYTELETMLEERVPYKLEKLSKQCSEKTGPNRARDTAAAARKALGLEKPGEGIRDICGLLQERAGIKVYPMPLASDTFFGLSVGAEDGGPAVVVNVWDRIPVERWIFTAAHELGHLLLHLSAYDVNRRNEDDAEEKEADQFASHFLMPDEVFKSEWTEAWGLPLFERVLKIKRIFKVSYKTVLYRLCEQGQGSDLWMQFQVAHKRRFGTGLKKTDEPQRLAPADFLASMVETKAADEPKRLSSDDFVEDRLCSLVRSAVDKQMISVGRAAEVLGFDLRTMREQVASWVD
jgi:Zn-dependent peptidase ImmA (M78 family)